VLTLTAVRTLGVDWSGVGWSVVVVVVVFVVVVVVSSVFWCASCSSTVVGSFNAFGD